MLGTRHHLCIWHVMQNITKKLSGVLGNCFEQFIKDFTIMRNCLAVHDFEAQWSKLLDRYQAASPYLMRKLYPEKEAWAVCFTFKYFNAGVCSTQRVESYNNVIKNSVTRSTTLLRLVDIIQEKLLKEDMHIEQDKLINAVPSVGIKDVAESYFGNILQRTEHFVTSTVQRMIKRQMTESIHYRPMQISLEEAYEIEQLQATDVEDILEDNYEGTFSMLKQIADSLNNKNIKEVWTIKRIGTSVGQFVIIFDEIGHLCTCYWLVSHGIPCRHFFAVLLESTHAQFHIKLVMERWFKDTVIKNTEQVLQEKPLKVSTGRNIEDDTSNSVHIDFTYLSYLRGPPVYTTKLQSVIDRRIRFGICSGLGKEAFDLAIDTGTDEELNEIFRKFIVEKKNLLVDKTSEFEKKKNRIVENPRIVKTKGRPIKRFKSALEKKTKVFNKQFHLRITTFYTNPLILISKRTQ